MTTDHSVVVGTTDHTTTQNYCTQSETHILGVGTVSHPSPKKNIYIYIYIYCNVLGVLFTMDFIALQTSIHYS
jgi:hypothetical protein